MEIYTPDAGADEDIVASTTSSTGPQAHALRTLERLPPLSPTLNRLLATLSHDEVSFAKISDLIEKDPVLAGNILGLVNSALYGLRGKVNSVRHAVSMLGIDKLRNTALSMSITKMWTRLKTPPDWSMTSFNRHALAVAILGDLLCQESNVDYPEGAFVAGLLHDLGKLLIAVGLPLEYEAVQKLRAGGEHSATKCERKTLGFTHADLSAEAIQAWNLPERIETAARFHHNPEADPSCQGTDALALSYAVAAANQYVNSMGVVTSGWTPGDDEFSRDPMEMLGIEARLPHLLEQFHAEFEAVRGLV